MRKGIVIVLVMLIALFSVAAKSGGDLYVGLTSGYVNTTINTDTGYKMNLNYESGHGFTVSVPLVYQINDVFGVETGVEFIQKSYVCRYTYVGMEGSDEVFEKATNRYIELPLSVSLSINREKVSASIGVGGYCGFWLSSYKEGVIYGDGANIELTEGVKMPYSGYYEFDKQHDNRFELGLLFSSSIEYKMDKALFVLRLSYRLGLSDMRKGQKYLSSEMRNNALVAECGVLYNFGGAK